MTSALPTLDLLRGMSDQRIVDHLVSGPATRADLASVTGLSKPTVSESVRRLTESGLVREGGQQQGRRGRSGTLVELDDTAGCALAIAAGAGSVQVEIVDVHGEVRARSSIPVAGPATGARFARALERAVGAVLPERPGPVRLAVASIADPIDDRTGRVLQLPDSPFLVGPVDPRSLIGELVPGPVILDNDVNWAAWAEHRLGEGGDDFVYAHLGEGLGAGLVIGGRLLAGSRGLAGEIAYVSLGDDPRTETLVGSLARWGLLVPGEGRIDIARVAALIDSNSARDRRLREHVHTAFGRTLGSVVTLLNPAAVILGGPLGTHPGVAAVLAPHIARYAAFDVAVRVARVPDPTHAGIRLRAATELRANLLA